MHLFSKEYMFLGVALCAIGIAAFIIFQQGLWDAKERCNKAHQKDSAKMQCWFDLVEHELHTGGVGAAMDMFKGIHQRYPAMAQYCHQNTHRVGDMVYFQVYLGTHDLKSLSFPQDATMCNYGFFHGFFEHLFQDNPVPAFISGTCMDMIARFGTRMTGMSNACWDGSGHGLMLARLDTVQKSEWGQVSSFVDGPLDTCARLSADTTRDGGRSSVEICVEGVFTTFFQSVVREQQYGFAFDSTDPFALCNAVSEGVKFFCFKSVFVSNGTERTPSQLLETLRLFVPEEFHAELFKWGIVKLAQMPAIEKEPETMLSHCIAESDVFFAGCVVGIIKGIFMNTDPQAEYPIAVRFCASDRIQERRMTDTCLEELSFHASAYTLSQ